MLHYIHLGLSKSGSASLQRSLRSDEINLIDVKWERNDLSSSFIAGCSNSSANDLKKFVNSRCRKNKINILSNENFCGNLITGESRIFYFQYLKNLFPKAIPFLIIRNNFERIESVYKHSVRYGYVGSRKNFYIQYSYNIDHGLNKSLSGSLLKNNLYYPLIKEVKAIFKKKPIVITLKDLSQGSFKSGFNSKKDNLYKYLYINKIAPINIQNSSNSNFSYFVQSKLNFFIKSNFNSSGIIESMFGHNMYTILHKILSFLPKSKKNNYEKIWKKILNKNDIKLIEEDIKTLKIKNIFY